MPPDFHMSRTNYPAVMTIYGVDDSQPDPGGERKTSIKGMIDNDSTMQSGGADVYVIDIQSQNAIASNWNITMAPSSTTTFGVQLTQPPTAPVTVTLSFVTNPVIDVAPTSLVFGVADYNVLQPVTVTSHAVGTTPIELSPTNNITPRVVVVSVDP
ncbi:MAG: hypothetical protein JWO36_7477 [Myxococcales bacterium]|nr:hypothetical protein [Myxococcales bacterium]